jgi:hypothetical protein
MTDTTTYEQQAYEMGCERARHAASWIIDGNTSEDHIRRVLAMMDDGDPQYEQFLPASPNLSGEWADDLTPIRLVIEIAGDGVDPDPIIDGICDAYGRGVDETFEGECERILRAAL